MKKLTIAGFLLIGIFGANAQTTIRITGSGTTLSSYASTAIGGGNSVSIGAGSGNALTTGTGSQNNVFVGTNTGMSNQFGAENTFLGWGAGAVNNAPSAAATNNSTSSYNTFLGRSAGGYNTLGGYNTFVGGLAGLTNTSGPGNVYVGFGAGGNNQTGGNNVCTGWGAGSTIGTTIYNNWGNSIYGSRAGNQSTGSGNVFIGEVAGFKAGNGNVMIGSHAGENETGDNKLFISNTNTSTPLIWGDFASSQLKMNGKVNIGSNPFPTNAIYSNYQLFVKGGILTDEVRVALSTGTGWADYVFAKDYKLKPLQEVEKFINTNGHLPNVPSAAQVKEEGINVAEMARIQQEKIEELTLYIIEQNKRIEALEAKMNTTK